MSVPGTAVHVGTPLENTAVVFGPRVCEDVGPGPH